MSCGGNYYEGNKYPVGELLAPDRPNSTVSKEQGKYQIRCMLAGNHKFSTQNYYKQARLMSQFTTNLAASMSNLVTRRTIAKYVAWTALHSM